jgi:hypothetical protein
VITGPQNPCENRHILAKVEREQERIRDENEWMHPDQGVEALTRRKELELRRSPGAEIPWNAVRWILPANADPLAPQDAARRAEFREELAETIDRAMAVDANPATEPSVAEAQPGDLDQLSVGVCTACRGSCCRSGGNHAYLTAETIARVLKSNPEWSPAQLLKSYLECLPDESVVDSCIYHSGAGCGLPRILRSETCNRHFCGKLKQLRSTLPRQPIPPVLGVLFDDRKWARTVLIDGSSVRTLTESGQE